MEQMTVERSIWIAAPRQRVWQAVSEPEQAARWLLPPAMGAEFKRNGSGQLKIAMGPMEVSFAAAEDSQPPRQLTLRGLPDGLVAATLTLDDENNGTRVTVRMSGLERLPEAGRQARLKPIEAAWDKALANLKAYIDGAELPYPEGHTAGMFGYRYEAQQTFRVERSIWINAARERVWAALTEAEKIEQWFSPGTTWVTTALEVGGRLYVPDANTGAELYAQVIEVLDPPHQLVLRAESQPGEMPNSTSYLLEEENGGTRLRLVYTTYATELDEGGRSLLEQHAFGFGMMLENIRAVAAGESLPYPGGF